MSDSPFSDFLSQPSGGGTDRPFTDALNGGPLLDRSANDAWRSSDFNDEQQAVRHDADLAAATPGYVTKGPGGDMSHASTPFDLGSLLGGAKDFGQSIFGPIGEAANAYENTRETNNPDLMAQLGGLGGLASSILGTPGRAMEYFSRNNTPVLGGASQAAEALFSPANAVPGAFALAAGQKSAQQGFGEGYKTLEGGQPATYDIPALLRALGAAGQATAEEQGKFAQDPNASPAQRAASGAFSVGLQAAPYAVPAPPIAHGLGRLFGRGAEAAAETARPAEFTPAGELPPVERPALPAPAERLALPEPTSIFAPSGAMPMRSPDFRGDITGTGAVRFPNVIDTTAREVRAPEAPAPRDISTDEGFRAQIEASKARQTPATAEDLAQRHPVSLADLIAQRRQVNVPLDAEQVAAARGEVTPAQAEHNAGLAADVAAREQALNKRMPTSLNEALFDTSPVYARFERLTPNSGMGGDLKVGDVTIRSVEHVPTGDVHDAEGAMASTHKLGSGTLILMRSNLTADEFRMALEHEAEHVRQPSGMSVADQERGAYAIHGQRPGPLAESLAAREDARIASQRAAGPLTARGITTTPVGREDLGLTGKRFQGPVPTLSADELRQRIGAPETITTPSGFTLDQRATQVHYANEDFIAAVRRAAEAPNARAAAEHWQAANDAAQKVRDLGGSLDHTLARARREGLPVPTPSQLPALSRPRVEAMGALTEQGVLKPRTFVRNLSDADLKAELARRTTANDAAQQRYSSLTRARSPLAADAARAAQGAAKSLDAVRKEITARGGSNAEVPTGRAGDARGLGNLVRGEAGSTTLENALGAGVARRLGLGDLFRGIGDRLGTFNREQGGEVPLTRERAAEIRAERARGPENIGQSFDRLVGNAGKPQEASAQGAPAGQRGPNAPRPAGARVMPTGPGAGGPPAPSRFSVNDLLRKAENATGATKTLTTALSPAHFMFRHALPVVAYPRQFLGGSLRGLGEGFRSSPEDIAARLQSMKSNAVANGMPNLRVDQPHGGIIAGHEDVPSSFMNRIPVLGEAIRRSNLGFTMGINEVRYALAKELVNSSNWMAEHNLAQPLTMADRRALADTANVYTGRGLDTSQMGAGGKAALRVANMAMFSPQMEAARIKMLGYSAKGLADIAANLAQGKAPNAVAVARARLGLGWIAGAGSLYLLMNAAGGKGPNLNLLSGTSGKVDIGAPGLPQGLAAFAAAQTGVGSSAYKGQNVMLDPTASESTLIRQIARLAVSIADRATGSTNYAKLTGTRETNPKDVASSAIINTLFTSPFAYPLAQWLGGRAATPTDAITPLPLSAFLTGVGIHAPEVGAKPEKAPTGGTTPRTGGAAPTRRPTTTARPAPTRRP